MTETPIKKLKRMRSATSSSGLSCRRMTPRFVIGVETDQWGVLDIACGVVEGVKVMHIALGFTGGAGSCPGCGEPRAIHDRREMRLARMVYFRDINRAYRTPSEATWLPRTFQQNQLFSVRCLSPIK